MSYELSRRSRVLCATNVLPTNQKFSALDVPRNPLDLDFRRPEEIGTDFTTQQSRREADHRELAIVLMQEARGSAVVSR